MSAGEPKANRLPEVMLNIAALLVLGATIILFITVLMRYGFGVGFRANQELTRYILVIISFIALGVLHAENQHIVVIQYQLPRYARVASAMAVVGFLLVVAYGAYKLAIANMDRDFNVLPISLFWFYAPVLVGSLLAAYYAVLRALD